MRAGTAMTGHMLPVGKVQSRAKVSRQKAKEKERKARAKEKARSQGCLSQQERQGTGSCTRRMAVSSMALTRGCGPIWSVRGALWSNSNGARKTLGECALSVVQTRLVGLQGVLAQLRMGMTGQIRGHMLSQRDI